MYILDTNILSALMKGEPAVVQKLEETPRQLVQVPQQVFAEIAYGLARMPQSQRKAMLEARFELLRTELDAAPWTHSVSDTFGKIKSRLESQGQRIEDFDAAVAAHAVADEKILVTRNVKHMSRVEGLTLETWDELPEH